MSPISAPVRLAYQPQPFAFRVQGGAPWGLRFFWWGIALLCAAMAMAFANHVNFSWAAVDAFVAAWLLLSVLVLALGFAPTHYPAQGVLQWDGQQWSWQSNGLQERMYLRALSSAIDAEHWMLLRAQPEYFGAGAPQTIWLWTTRVQDAEHWIGLRRTVFSPTSAQAPSN